MTSEEAINIIKSECYVFNPLNFDRSTSINTALDMAIKTLEQEPSNDLLLKVQDVWEKVREMCGTGAKKYTYNDGWNEAIKSVDELFTEAFGDAINADSYEGDPKDED